MRRSFHDIGDTHIPSPRFLPKFHSMPPALHTVPGDMLTDAVVEHRLPRHWLQIDTVIDRGVRPLVSWSKLASVPLTYVCPTQRGPD
jgi:hypothetical protein